MYTPAVPHVNKAWEWVLENAIDPALKWSEPARIKAAEKFAVCFSMVSLGCLVYTFPLLPMIDLSAKVHYRCARISALFVFGCVSTFLQVSTQVGLSGALSRTDAHTSDTYLLLRHSLRMLREVFTPNRLAYMNGKVSLSRECLSCVNTQEYRDLFQESVGLESSSAARRRAEEEAARIKYVWVVD